MYFDTHAHYDSGAFNADWKELLASMPQKGVELIVNPGCDLESSRTAVALAEEFPHVYAAVGVHPSDCGEWGEGTLLELRQLASRPKVRAIGEIGLDYYSKDNPPRALQQNVFHRQLELAQSLRLPVIVHDREAHQDCLSIVREHPQVTGRLTATVSPLCWSTRRCGGSFTASPAVPKWRKRLSSGAGIWGLTAPSPTRTPERPWRSSTGSLWTGS